MRAIPILDPTQTPTLTPEMMNEIKANDQMKKRPIDSGTHEVFSHYILKTGLKSTYYS